MSQPVLLQPIPFFAHPVPLSIVNHAIEKIGSWPPYCGMLCMPQYRGGGKIEAAPPPILFIIEISNQFSFIT